jgi:mannose-6-phosphate isomerase-like protein (cupin superfamily)
MQYEDVQRSALENNSFRKVLFTNKHSQVVLMSLPPGEDIGSEVHDTVDQCWFS